jgi:hypothetical protein
MNASFRVCTDLLSIESVNRDPIVVAFRTHACFDPDRRSTLPTLGDDGAARPTSELRQEVFHANSGL